MIIKKLKLPPNYKRSLSVVARSIEDSLNDIAARLQSKPSNATLHRIMPSFTDAERAFINKTLEEIRSSLIVLAETYDIHPLSVTEAQILKAQYAHLWTLLQDSYYDKMKGYGKISAEEASLLDKYIAQLAEQVEKLRRVISSNER